MTSLPTRSRITLHEILPRDRGGGPARPAAFAWMVLGLLPAVPGAAPVGAQSGTDAPWLPVEELEFGPGEAARFRVQSRDDRYYLLHRSGDLLRFSPGGSQNRELVAPPPTPALTPQ